MADPQPVTKETEPVLSLPAPVPAPAAEKEQVSAPTAAIPDLHQIIGEADRPLAPAPAGQKPAPAEPPKAVKPHAPEQVVKLVNGQKGARAEFEFSSWGATLKSATLLEFSEKPGPRGDDNRP